MLADATVSSRALKAPVSCISRSVWSGPEMLMTVASGSELLSNSIFIGIWLRLLPPWLLPCGGAASVAAAAATSKCTCTWREQASP